VFPKATHKPTQIKDLPQLQKLRQNPEAPKTPAEKDAIEKQIGDFLKRAYRQALNLQQACAVLQTIPALEAKQKRLESPDPAFDVNAGFVWEGAGVGKLEIQSGRLTGSYNAWKYVGDVNGVGNVQHATITCDGELENGQPRNKVGEPKMRSAGTMHCHAEWGAPATEWDCHGPGQIRLVSGQGDFWFVVATWNGPGLHRHRIRKGGTAGKGETRGTGRKGEISRDEGGGMESGWLAL
jgi:hypothetical protein